MIYEVQTDVDKANGLIFQKVVSKSPSIEDPINRNRVDTVVEQVINTQEIGIRKALNALGWHHSSEIGALDVPNPGADSRYPPINFYHRVTVADVQKMEEQIRLIAKALHL